MAHPRGVFKPVPSSLVMGTTPRVFPLDGVRARFQIMRLFPRYRAHFFGEPGFTLPPPLIRRHGHYVVSREPQDDRRYLFTPSASLLRHAR
jgi:hypothetical protein